MATQDHLIPPECITPRDIRSMTDEEIDAALELIRARRMQAKIVYDQSMELREAAQHKRLEAAFDKKMNTLLNGLEKIDRALEKLDKQANDVRGLRLQLGVDPL